MKKCCVPNPDTAIKSLSHSAPPFLQIYQKLLTTFGHQNWWPASSRFEVIVGAILTQNTNWRNVEQAIANLRRARQLSALALQEISEPNLAQLIKPAGFFQVKAKRLKNFMRFFFEEFDGRLDRMARQPMEILRPQLLSINGIGGETADCILLYALGKSSFVVDAYTRRILLRHGMIQLTDSYEAVRQKFMDVLPQDRQLYNEYHALIVQLGKQFCRTSPLCEICPVREVSLPVATELNS